MTAIDDEALLTEVQAADYLALSVRTLQAWRVRGGGPPYCKIGRAVRYKRRALLEFQEKHVVSSTTQAGIARDSRDGLRR